MMDKERLKNELGEYSRLIFSGSECWGNGLSLKMAEHTIDNFDDTPTTEQAWEKIAEKYDKSIANVEADFEDWINSGRTQTKEKPEIPKFVADWIEEKRPYYSLMTMVGNYLNGFGMPERLEEWITDNFNDYVKALVNGYTIEKQPVWIVKAPYDRYFGGFLEKGQHAEINFSHINKDNAQKFEDKSKAVAVATLVDGTVEEWSE